MHKRSSWRRYRNYVWLIPLFATALTYQIADSVVASYEQLHEQDVVFPPFLTTAGVVDWINGSVPGNPVKLGDKIIAVDGVRAINAQALFGVFRSHKPHDTVEAVIAPKGQTAQKTVSVPVTSFAEAPGHLRATALAAVGIVMFLCVCVGIYVAAVRPYDARALILFGLMISISQITRLSIWFQFPRAMWIFADLWNTAAVLTWATWLMLFGLYFPEQFAWDRRRPWLKWTFVIPITLWNLLFVIEEISEQVRYHMFPVLERVLQVRLLKPSLLIAVGITFFFAALGTKRATAKNADACRRLRVLLVGSGIGLGPLGLLVLYESVEARENWSALPQWLVLGVVCVFCLFPLTLAYVVLVERAMDVRMVVRQGARYALARGGVRVVLGLAAISLMAGVDFVLFRSRLNREITIPLTVVIAIACFIVVRKARSKLFDRLDRRYFREAVRAEALLEDLSESVRTIVDEQQLLDTVAQTISSSLHVPRVAILLGSNGVFRPVYAMGLDLHKHATVAIPEDSKTVATLKDSSMPAPIYFDREDNWVHASPHHEVLTLRELGAELLLPVGPKNRVLGLLSLGPKRSDLPYSKTDIQLLRSVAAQTGLALENSRLTSAVATEVARRERLNREIEIAREVQERLFPQRLPAIAGIDFSGACRPALGVGGDYYDFLKLANGDLGIAIGDVSGKGIAAALLMASLQASLRGQALTGLTDLAKLMSNVNQLVYDATPPNRYATFFYGQYNQATRIFSYVNAGHNPPIVLRHTNDGTIHVIRLETGGPVVGLFPGAPYQQGCLDMEPGHIFIGFTDGISEAMNKSEEEWGEERFIPAVAACAEASAEEMIPRLMAEADRFVDGAPQHDDMTLVVVKVGETLAH